MTAIITCESCHTQYRVQGASIGAGRAVKCTKCGHSWHQAHVDDDPALSGIPIPPIEKPVPTAAEIKDSTINVTPKVKKVPPPPKPKEAPLLLKLLLPLLVMANLIVGLIGYKDTIERRVPAMRTFYEAIDDGSTEGITIDNASVKVADAGDDHQSLSFKFDIDNGQKKEISGPLIRVSQLDKDKQLIKADTMSYNTVTIQPGASFSVKDLGYEKIPQETEFLEIEVGNKWELMLR